MDARYSLQYQGLYEKHWWWRARERLILSTIEQIRSGENLGSILDVGCGGGLLFDRLVKFGDVEGVETNPLVVTDENPWKGRIHVSAFDDKFQPNKRYSLILMLDVLEHFADADACLRKAMELLRRNGVLLLTVPAFSCLWTSHDDLNHHLTRYTRRSLLNLTSGVGLKTVHCRYFFHWGFPAKLLVRYKEHLFGAAPRPPEVPSHSVNLLLYWLSVAEQRVSRSLPLPFGSSIVAVCSKQ